MKNASKLTALLLAMVMVLSLASCGKTGDESKTGDEKVKLVVGVPTSANVVTYDEGNAFTRWLEENSGYEIEVMQFATEYPTQLSTMAAGNEKLPDIMFNFAKLNKQMQTYYGSEGYFLNLKPYLEDEELTADYRARMAELYGPDHFDYSLRSVTVADGNIYGYPTINISTNDLPWFQVYINTKWLDNLGLEMPTNYDELVEVLRAFKNGDPNQNGKADEIPAMGMTYNRHWDLPSWIINNWIFVNDGTFFNDVDGQLMLPYDTDEYREGVKALHDLVEEGLLSPLSWTVKENTEYKSILSPVDDVAKVGVFSCHLASAFNENSHLLDEYEALLPFNYAPLKSYMPGSGVFISADTEYPDECFRLLQLISTEAGSMACVYGEEGVDWEWGIDYVTGETAVHKLRTFSQANSSTWSASRAILVKHGLSTKYHDAIMNPPESMTWVEKRTMKNNQYAVDYIAIAEQANPEAYVDTLVYNDEENDILGNMQVDVMDYVKEYRAKFASGELDPHDDAQWNKYVQNLHDMGTDVWLEQSQIAYERWLNG